MLRAFRFTGVGIAGVGLGIITWTWFFPNLPTWTAVMFWSFVAYFSEKWEQFSILTTLDKGIYLFVTGMIIVAIASYVQMCILQPIIIALTVCFSMVIGVFWSSM